MAFTIYREGFDNLLFLVGQRRSIKFQITKAWHRTDDCFASRVISYASQRIFNASPNCRANVKVKDLTLDVLEGEKSRRLFSHDLLFDVGGLDPTDYPTLRFDHKPIVAAGALNHRHKRLAL